MSSLFTSNGKYVIDFKFNGSRQRIRLGQLTENQAGEFRSKLESLIQADTLGVSVPLETSQWLVSLDPRIHNILVGLGLAVKRMDTLGQLLDEWRQSLKPETANGPPVTAFVANVQECFGNQRLRSITQYSPRVFHEWLISQGYSDATISRRMRSAKQLFSFAVKHRCLSGNPFQDASVKGSEVNRDKDVYVTTGMVDKLLAASDDAELSAVICLVRYGGLRCPSEVKPFQLSQIDWDNGQFTVLSPKTKSHGHDRRTVPLDQRLREALDKLPHVGLAFPSYQGSHSNTTSALKKLCAKAGVTWWDRPFDNMRASCITDWIRTYWTPGSRYTVMDIAEWAGHDPKTMLKHYAQVRKEDGAKEASFNARVASSA